MSEPGRLAPIDDSERAEILDALRGFALLGILISHVPAFSGYEYLPAAQRAALDHFGIDRPLGALCELLIRGKFFSLFSLLFGIGFAIQLESAGRRGARFARHFARRLAILFGIGLVHGLIWYGDILRDYALLGLFLIPTARWGARRTGRAALALLAARAIWPLLLLSVAAELAPLASSTASGDPTQHFFELTRALASPSWLGAFDANLKLLRIKALQLIYEGKAISILAMFLVGAYVGKTRMYRDSVAHERTLKRVFAICAPIGIVGNAALVPLHASAPDYPPSLIWVCAQLLFAIAVPAMAAAYASGFALLFARPAGRVLRLFAPTGRMALTTYFGETLIGVFLFYGVGLGWSGGVGQVACVSIALAIFALQSAAAGLWLRRYRFGPLEWCWRRATYGLPLAMRKR